MSCTYLGDVYELFDFVDDKYAIMCVQHDYSPKETTKMDGPVETAYPRKNKLHKKNENNIKSKAILNKSGGEVCKSV